MNKIFLIIQREYLTRIKKKSFIIMTILGPLLMAGLFTAVAWMSLSESETEHVLVVDRTPALFSELKSNDQIKYDYTSDLTLPEAKKLFHNSKYNSLLHIPENIIKGSDLNMAQLFFKKQPSNTISKQIEINIEKIAEEYRLELFFDELNVEDSDLNKNLFYRIKTNLNLSTIKFTEPGKEEEVLSEQAWVGFIFGLLIYVFIFMYGVQVMRGVIEEKTNRIVEVIISSVKPFQLMLGKIVGVAMVGLTQFLIWVVLTFTMITLAQTVLLSEFYDPAQIQNAQMSAEMVKQVQGDAQITTEPNKLLQLLDRINFPLMLGMFLFYFMGGYLLYSALFAAIGAAVDSETDTQQFMVPVTLPLILAYMASILIIENPEGAAAFWFSIIPLTSPIVMMVRIAIGFEYGDLWQLYLSMGLLVAGFLLTTWVAAKIYRTGVLMYGKKISYKELWKWLKYKS